MDGDLLRVALAEVMVRRKLEGGEFSYIFIPSGEEIAGKKSAFKLLKSDEDLFDEIRESNRLDDETDGEFDARTQKMLPNLPFEEKQPVIKPAPQPTPTKQTTPKPVPAKQKTPKQTPPSVKKILKSAVKDYNELTKSGLSQLVARRRLEGGEFTYVYLPLEKVVSGKKPLLFFIKNQLEFKQLVQKGKDPGESNDEFDNRVLKLLPSVPFEKEVKEVAEEATSSPPPEVPQKGVVNAGCKRKSENAAKKAKKPKIDLSGSTRTVFVDVEVFKSQQVPFQISQIGAIEDKPTNPKKFFRPIQSPKFNKLSDGCLEKMNMRRSPNGLMFKKFRNETPCVHEARALQQFISYLEMTKNNSINLTLVTYRKETEKHLITALKNNGGLIQRFSKLVTSLVCFEDILEEESDWGYYPLIPLNELLTKTVGHKGVVKNVCVEESAETLLKIANKLQDEHNYSLAANSHASSYVVDMAGRKGPQGPKMADHSFSVINSVSFIKNEKFVLEEQEQSSASTSKVDSKPPPKPQQAQSSTKQVSVKKPVIEKEVEAMEVDEDEDEDDNSFTPVGSEVLFSVLCQPILVKLGNVDENTKFVKFNMTKDLLKKSKSNSWELLPASAKVFWRQEKPYAFCHLCPTSVLHMYKSEKATIMDSMPAGSSLGTFRALNKTDEEQRNLSTKVSLDLVVVKANDSDPSNLKINKDPTSVMVKMMIKEGSLTSGKVKDFVLRPSDVLILVKSNVDGIEFLNNLVSVDRKQAVTNRAKVVVCSTTTKKVLKEGQILGSAILFQNDVKLLFSKLAEHNVLNQVVETPVRSSPSVKSAALKVANKMKRPLVTLGNSRLYAQGSNPLLVKLDQYQATRVSSKFNKASIKFSDEFNQVIDDNKHALQVGKLKEKDSVVKVYWKNDIPYAFVNIKISPSPKKQSIDFCDIVSGYELGSYAPLEYCPNPEESSKINMSVCVDFSEKHVMVESHPKLVKVYLKFRDAEVDKQKVLEEVFSIQKVYNSRIDILSVVFKPDCQSKLAPQKTSTNDMKAVLVVKAKEEGDVVTLTSRVVLADCCSIEPKENLKLFTVCGRKLSAPPQPPPPQVFDEPEPQMMNSRRHRTPMGDQYEDLHNPFVNEFSRERDYMDNPFGGNMYSSQRMMDRDYMDYQDPQEMALSMDRQFTGRLPSRGENMSFSGGFPGQGRGRGSVHSRLGEGGRAKSNLGVRPLVANPMHEPKQAPKEENRNNLFEQARNQSIGGSPRRGSQRGLGSGGPQRGVGNGGPMRGAPSGGPKRGGQSGGPQRGNSGKSGPPKNTWSN